MNEILYIMCGNPSLEITKYNILRNQKASLFVLNIPFSDPVAENPDIQKANMNALKNNTTIIKVFEMLADVKESNKVDIVLRIYANIIYSYGIEAFVRKCKDVGVKGIIIVDVPYEEQDEFKCYCDQYDVGYIPTITKNSLKRIEQIVKDARYLIYIQANAKEDIETIVQLLRQYTNIPYITDKQFKHISFNIF